MSLFDTFDNDDNSDNDEQVISLTATDNKTTIQFVNKIVASGCMKDVYFSPDKKYVVGFFRKPLDSQGKSRIEQIVTTYKSKIFEQSGGDYWKNLFCWPTQVVEWEGKLGIVCPTYPERFIFKNNKFAGKEKEGKWFASAKLRNKHLTETDKGDWCSYLRICIQIARAVRRLHAAGLAHSDLSYKNILIDPLTGTANIIDIDGLVVPGKFPPDVEGTPDFIAPEVLETNCLPKNDKNRKLPCIATDKHALAVLIYMYLLYRHPLRGSRVCDVDDPTVDEKLSMGKMALFIEHPTDSSNRPKLKDLDKCELPQRDIKKMPYTICGPYLKELFDKAFIKGLHSPSDRPNAAEWETALVKTIDLIQPCSNPDCQAKWFVFDNSRKPKCPFCGKSFKDVLPVIDLYYCPKQGESFRSENHRLMVYTKQNLYKWHVNRFIFPNEKLMEQDKKPVGDFHFHNGKWILINRALDSMYEIIPGSDNRKIEIGEYVELNDGTQILLSKENGGRLAIVSLANT